MKLSTLKNKLAKMNIETSVFDYNGFNKELIFVINGVKVQAGFNTDSDKVTDFCTVLGYDNANQEHQRSFFSNFAQVQRYVNR
jgi:hypothetical protein